MFQDKCFYSCLITASEVLVDFTHTVWQDVQKLNNSQCHVSTFICLWLYRTPLSANRHVLRIKTITNSRTFKENRSQTVRSQHLMLGNICVHTSQGLMRLCKQIHSFSGIKLHLSCSKQSLLLPNKALTVPVNVFHTKLFVWKWMECVDFSLEKMFDKRETFYIFCLYKTVIPLTQTAKVTAPCIYVLWLHTCDYNTCL
jgi:hypothetical protein